MLFTQLHSVFLEVLKIHLLKSNEFPKRQRPIFTLSGFTAEILLSFIPENNILIIQPKPSAFNTKEVGISVM